MVWRLFTFLVIAFWLVMTVLLVRVTYYPEGSQFATLPAGAVFRMFIDRGAINNTNTLYIYHNEKKCGYVTPTPRRIRDEKTGTSSYLLMLAGLLDKGSLESVDSAAAWHLNVGINNADHWGGMAGWVRLTDIAVAFDFDWPDGQATPKFSLRQNGQVTADEKSLQAMLPLMLHSPPPGVPTAGTEDSAFHVKAREGLMVLAGQKRRVYVMEFTIMDQYRAKAYFTEAGELALVEMPDGWRALNQLIYGLVPEIPEPEE